MKLGIGIFLVVAGLIFLRPLIRVLPPGRYRLGYLRPTKWFDTLKPLSTLVIICGVGVALVFDVTWWILLIGAALWLLLSYLLGRFNPEGDLMIPPF